MKHYCVSIVLLLFFLGHSQENPPTKQYGDKYLEDQFYIGLGFNLLMNKPTDVAQTSLSYNLQTGFIKDIPFNAKRNFGIGVGFGYATNSYYSNIVATQANNTIAYQVGGVEDFRRSKFETHAIELPFELRWRTSNASDYKFWRIYTGAKFGYVFAGESRLLTELDKSGFSNDDIEKLQYGLMLSFGYNTWNVHAYYSLNPLLKDDVMINGGESIDLRVLRIGVIFYIL
ncbi:porin family protein [Flagellimonas sp. S3867]|uniref:porin family protein n=1 Tax=Flagellimonas sp. S3867 TaxID=2768063 RepID=UPI001683E7C9|nr:porin family protein [Flagellimonas sp. S3867]